VNALLWFIEAYKRVGAPGGKLRGASRELNQNRAFNIAHANAVKALGVSYFCFGDINFGQISLHESLALWSPGSLKKCP
jgi:hypothetical protein